VKTHEDLRRLLLRLDGRGYKAYKEIKDAYRFPFFVLVVDHVQGDPFAAPSSMRVQVDRRTAGFPPSAYANRSREIAFRDFLTRAFHRSCRETAARDKGSGKSGLIEVDAPGQEILERTSAVVSDGDVEVRFSVGLPAFGRRIAGRNAVEMLCGELPRIVEKSLLFKNTDEGALTRHVDAAEDADVLRAWLREEKLVAFIADGAVLPRRSGVDPRPLTEGKVVPFASCPELRKTVELPHRGRVTGMGIPEGVTLIAGGGYHGKTTLLEAIQYGIYNHVPGDGRELVVSREDTVKIRAEDGRRVECVDISPFINNLPFGRDTRAFSTEDASGSTSQAANIIEAVQAGAGVLLIDEDTSATNFMIRDRRMQELVAAHEEPITPFIDRVRQLYRERGVSTVVVIGGSGDYFDVADHVICMKEYLPVERTADAKAIAARDGGGRRYEGEPGVFDALAVRMPVARSFDPSRGKRDVKIKARGRDAIEFGRHRIDLSCVEQIVDSSQVTAIGDAVHYAVRFMQGDASLEEVIRRVMKDVREKGLNVLGRPFYGSYAAFRSFELAAAINRLPTLRMRVRGRG